MHWFGVPNFRKLFCHECIQSRLLDTKWCLGVFQSISQTFGMKNITKLVFWGWMHYFVVPNFRKLFCHVIIQSNQLDPKWCLGVFQSIPQTFGTKNHAKLVFLALKALVRDIELLKKSLATNASNLPYWTQNNVWECFIAFCRPSAWKLLKNLCFGDECTISGYRTSGKSFATNTSNLTY